MTPDPAAEPVPAPAQDWPSAADQPAAAPWPATSDQPTATGWAGEAVVASQPGGGCACCGGSGHGGCRYSDELFAAQYLCVSLAGLPAVAGHSPPSGQFQVTRSVYPPVDAPTEPTNYTWGAGWLLDPPHPVPSFQVNVRCLGGGFLGVEFSYFLDAFVSGEPGHTVQYSVGRFVYEVPAGSRAGCTLGAWDRACYIPGTDVYSCNCFYQSDAGAITTACAGTCSVRCGPCDGGFTYGNKTGAEGAGATASAAPAVAAAGTADPPPDCDHRGPDLSGADRDARGLDHSRRWALCMAAGYEREGQPVCPCTGCGPACPRYEVAAD